MKKALVFVLFLAAQVGQAQSVRLYNLAYDFLTPGNNLSEVSNPATARTNLGAPASANGTLSNPTVTGVLRYNNAFSTSGKPTVALSSEFGSGATAEFRTDDTNESHELHIIFGSNPSTFAIATVTFSNPAYTRAPNCLFSTVYNSAPLQLPYWSINAKTTQQYTFLFLGTPVVGMEVIWAVSCRQ